MEQVVRQILIALCVVGACMVVSVLGAIAMSLSGVVRLWWFRRTRRSRIRLAYVAPDRIDQPVNRVEVEECA